MSEIVEAIGRSLDAFNRRDLEGWLDVYHRDAEFMDGLTLSCGHPQLEAWFHGWDKVWDDIELADLTGVWESDEMVVVRWTARGRGKGSGVHIAQDFYASIVHREGKLARVDCYGSEAEALAAARAAAPQREEAPSVRGSER